MRQFAFGFDAVDVDIYADDTAQERVDIGARGIADGPRFCAVAFVETGEIADDSLQARCIIEPLDAAA